MEDPLVLLPELERRLLDGSVRADPAEACKLLADDFREFGSSGRVWARSEILEALVAETPVRLEASDFEVQMLSTELALLTWRSTKFVDGERRRDALRSSLWRLEQEQWRMFFHQGTPIA
jgi:hypothetical protein